MAPWQLVFSLVPALILFLYGIEHFSQEILAVAKGKFGRLLGSLTATPVKGAVLGAGVTALVQSSAATTVITIGLVNAGIISFLQSLGIIIGSNIGTTITAQLVAFKLTAFGPAFIVLGFLIGLFGRQYRFLGKPIFYFGLVFFSLSLLSDTLLPYQNDPEIISLLSQYSTIPLALLAGFLFTVMVQSSSVTSGIVVLLAQGGFITLPHAILLLFGANIGSTTTSLVASAPMGLYARRSATAHFLFNIGGVLLVLPFLSQFESLVLFFGGTDAQHVANAHLLFNLIAAVVFLLLIRQFAAVVERIIPGTEREVLLKTTYLTEDLPDDNSVAFEQIEKEIQRSFEITRELFADAVRLLSEDSRDVRQKTAKLRALALYLDEEIERALRRISRRRLSPQDATRAVLYIRMSNLITRLGDWGYDFTETIGSNGQRSAATPADLKHEVIETYAVFEKNMQALATTFPGMLPEIRDAIKHNDMLLRERLNRNYQLELGHLTKDDEFADSIVVDLLSIIENANGIVHVMRKLAEMYSSLSTMAVQGLADENNHSE
ncbi:MAG: Na/Pi cotransporter family protein [Methanomicrobiales archaeon]|nr:Na/Pi cotransporter family protein [Methanomicrobiales archaeon]